jgi:CheY-like chemotaxis protein
MRILVASSSVFRQRLYCQAIENLGHVAGVTSSGLECAEQLRSSPPDVLLLEAPLTWGGTEAVLEIAQCQPGESRIPVILVAVGMGSIDWFQLSRYRIDDILFRVPTVRELEKAIAAATEHQPVAVAPATGRADGDQRVVSRQDDNNSRSTTQPPHWQNTNSHSIGHSW